MHAKALKRAVVKALKGRTKQELACEDVEAQAESDKMESEVLVTVKGSDEGSDLQKVHNRQCVICMRPVASGQLEKSYEQEQKFQSGKRWKEFA